MKRKERGFEETLEQHGLYGKSVRGVDDIANDVMDQYGLVKLVKRKKPYRLEDEEEEE